LLILGCQTRDISFAYLLYMVYGIFLLIIRSKKYKIGNFLIFVQLKYTISSNAWLFLAPHLIPLTWQILVASFQGNNYIIVSWESFIVIDIYTFCLHCWSAGIDNIDLIFARLIAIFPFLVHYGGVLQGDRVIWENICTVCHYTWLLAIKKAQSTCQFFRNTSDGN